MPPSRVLLVKAAAWSWACGALAAAAVAAGREHGEHGEHPRSADFSEECDGWPQPACERYFEWGAEDAFDALHLEPTFRPLDLAKFLAHLRRNPEVKGRPRRFAVSELLPVSPAFYYTEARTALSEARQACTGKIDVSLRAADADAWARVSGHFPCKQQGASVCKCRHVICWPAPAAASEPDEPDEPDEADEPGGACRPLELQIVGLVLPRRPLFDLGLLTAFSELQFLDASGVPNLAGLPPLAAVRTLRLNGRIPPALPATLRWLSVELSERTLPAALEQVCALPELLVLRLLGGVVALPRCLGNLRELRSLDVRGGRLGEAEPPSSALPKELERLEQLVSFVAFGQGLVTCSNPRRCPPHPSCRPTLETMKDPGEMAYHCDAIQKTWKEDLNSMPIFKWSKLERFWVDQNALVASPGFFGRAARAWPRLRSLDLYNNALASDIAEYGAFAGHPLLHQATLQHNDLHGRLPLEVLNGTSPYVGLIVDLNPRLKGCVPQDLPMAAKLSADETGIEVRDTCPRSGADEL